MWKLPAIRPTQKSQVKLKINKRTIIVCSVGTWWVFGGCTDNPIASVDITGDLQNERATVNASITGEVDMPKSDTANTANAEITGDIEG